MSQSETHRWRFFYSGSGFSVTQVFLPLLRGGIINRTPVTWVLCSAMKPGALTMLHLRAFASKKCEKSAYTVLSPVISPFPITQSACISVVQRLSIIWYKHCFTPRPHYYHYISLIGIRYVTGETSTGIKTYIG